MGILIVRLTGAAEQEQWHDESEQENCEHRPDAVVGKTPEEIVQQPPYSQSGNYENHIVQNILRAYRNSHYPVELPRHTAEMSYGSAEYENRRTGNR